MRWNRNKNVSLCISNIIFVDIRNIFYVIYYCFTGKDKRKKKLKRKADMKKAEAEAARQLKIIEEIKYKENTLVHANTAGINSDESDKFTSSEEDESDSNNNNSNNNNSK